MPRDDLNVEAFRNLPPSIAERYPEIHETFRVTGAVNFDQTAASSQTVDRTQVGFRINHISKDRLFSAQVDGWSFNKLAPYESWEEFKQEGQDLWAWYRNTASPQKISRVALRYVNRLDLPLPIADFNQYLKTVPEVGPDLPQGLSNFFMQLQIPHQDVEALLILNMAMVPPVRADIVSIVLDLDIFRVDNIPQNDEELWLYLEQLRIKKNRAFEACITDAMRELFF